MTQHAKLTPNNQLAPTADSFLGCPTRGRDLKKAIFVRSGCLFWPLEPYEDELNIDDVIHALPMLPRYTAATEFFYSVAWHSYALSYIVPPEHAGWALVHDITEVYFTDLPYPVKSMPEFKIYEEAENRLMRMWAGVLGIEPTMPDIVKKHDRAMGYIEMPVLFPEVGSYFIKHAYGVDAKDYEHLQHWVRPMEMDQVRKMWKRRFNELFPSYVARHHSY